ncbi:MAG TPA: hypothetical protein VGK73_03510 [Polyangiaceae bacterium]
MPIVIEQMDIQPAPVATPKPDDAEDGAARESAGLPRPRLEKELARVLGALAERRARLRAY